LVETANADEALAAVSGGAVDIALIDFNMPGRWTGIGCDIRKTHPNMPVAVVSANVRIYRARPNWMLVLFKPPGRRSPCRISFEPRFGKKATP
jgi:CheY-like chemotaxis protein